MALLQLTSVDSIFTELKEFMMEAIRESTEILMESLMKKFAPFFVKSEDGETEEERELESDILIPMFQQEENDVDLENNKDTGISKDCGEQRKGRYNMEWDFVFKTKYFNGNSFQPKEKLWRKMIGQTEGVIQCSDCLCLIKQELEWGARPKKRKKKEKRQRKG